MFISNVLPQILFHLCYPREGSRWSKGPGCPLVPSARGPTGSNRSLRNDHDITMVISCSAKILKHGTSNLLSLCHTLGPAGPGLPLHLVTSGNLWKERRHLRMPSSKNSGNCIFKVRSRNLRVKMKHEFFFLILPIVSCQIHYFK